MVENKPPQELEAKPAAQALRLWNGLLENAGKIRDIGLVVGAATYVLGYLVWEFHAWRLNIGLLPAFDLQYLIGGAIPVLSVALAALVLILLWRAIGRVLGRVDKFISDTPTLDRRLRQLGAISALIFVASFIAESYVPGRLLQRAFFYLFVVSGVLAGVTVMRVLIRPYMAFILLVSTLLWLTLYVAFIYSEIPQEWGGGKPKCGSVDLAWREVSPETARDLLKTKLLDPQVPTARSVSLDVLYLRGDTIVLRTRNEQVWEPATVHQVPKELIKAIEWCP